MKGATACYSRSTVCYCREKPLQVVWVRLSVSRVGSCRVCSGRLGRIRLFWPFETLSLDLLGVQRPIGRTLGLRWGYCALESVFRLCCWALQVYPHCIVCVTAHPDIIALVGTLSRAGLTWGTSLSTWESPWKRAPKVTPGRFSPRAGRKPTGGTLMSMGGTPNVHGRDAKCLRAGRGRDSKSSSPPSRSIFQAKTGGAM